MERSHRLILASAVLLAGSVACGPAKDPAPPAGGEVPSGVEAGLRDVRAQVRAHAPVAGRPTRNADGAPQPIDLRAPREDAQADPDCPEEVLIAVRAEQGSTCADYQAEISVYVGRCVAACDTAALAARTVRIAMGACSAWCSERKCGTASFIPPATCAVAACYTPRSECLDVACRLREYCSLIDGNRVWNCFCRDMLPG